MTSAAFQATFSDWKLIKGRKVVQVVLELPIEQADHAYQVLGGMPDPGKSVWCAVARLNPVAGAGTHPASRPSADGTQGDAPNPGGQHVGRSKDTHHDDRKGSAVDDPAPRQSRRFNTLPLPQQAALLCADPVFRAFLKEEHGYICNTEDGAANAIRLRCGIQSRAELATNKTAGEIFTADRERFLAWRLVDA